MYPPCEHSENVLYHDASPADARLSAADLGVHADPVFHSFTSRACFTSTVWIASPPRLSCVHRSKKVRSENVHLRSAWRTSLTECSDDTHVINHGQREIAFGRLSLFRAKRYGFVAGVTTPVPLRPDCLRSLPAALCISPSAPA